MKTDWTNLFTVRNWARQTTTKRGTIRTRSGSGAGIFFVGAAAGCSNGPSLPVGFVHRTPLEALRDSPRRAVCQTRGSPSHTAPRNLRNTSSAAERDPDRVAVLEPSGVKITYRELAQLSDAAAARSWHWESNPATAWVSACGSPSTRLRPSGHPPVNALRPCRSWRPPRDAYILSNCNVRNLCWSPHFDAAFREQSAALDSASDDPESAHRRRRRGLRAC